jgi:hypothetical protein
MQSESWAPSTTNLPSKLQSAVSVLFRAGMADPRGCEYREIELPIRDPKPLTGSTTKTHGWILPKTSGDASNYAIGWNGLIYPVISIGGPANFAEDARTLAESLGPPSIPNQMILDYGAQCFTDEEYSLDLRWLTQAKAAMIIRCGPSDLVDKCAQLFPREDPFLSLSSGYLWNAFDRTVGAHAFGDDELAYATAITLENARKLCEAEAKARGFELPPTPLGMGPYGPDDIKREYYYPFLRHFSSLFEDQIRRHQRQTPLPDPAAAKSKDERIAALIGQLENVAGSNYSSAIKALVAEGWDAIEPVLQSYENDRRLTRFAPVNWQEAQTERNVVEVRSAAYAILEGILETPQFAPQLTRNDTVAESEDRFKASALAIREYWNRYRGLSQNERLYAILREDHGNWNEAAAILVQPTNQPVMPTARWTLVPQDWPLNPTNATPIRGESLRANGNPSVTDLIIKRIHDCATRQPENGDVASQVDNACDLAISLARWDPAAAVRQCQWVSTLAFEILAPSSITGYVSHSDLAGHLPTMIMFLARAGDSNALKQYGGWLKSLDPTHLWLPVSPMLEPILKFPDSPAWDGVWEALFDDEKSPWFNALFKHTASGTFFNVDKYFGTPFINKRPFRNCVLRLLQDKAPGGKLVGDATHGWYLDQQLAAMRQYGLTVPAPANAAEAKSSEFRACDLYAWLLSNRIEGAPEFQLYWPEARRDETISALERMLKTAGATVKTRPFQEG